MAAWHLDPAFGAAVARNHATFEGHEGRRPAFDEARPRLAASPSFAAMDRLAEQCERTTLVRQAASLASIPTWTSLDFNAVAQSSRRYEDRRSPSAQSSRDYDDDWGHYADIAEEASPWDDPAWMAATAPPAFPRKPARVSPIRT